MESKRKHGFLKAALPAFAMLLVAVLSLTTVTFAWFTSGTEANVGEFELDVAAGGGLEISTKDGDDAVWKSTLTAAEIGEIEAVKAFLHGSSTSQLSPVSTIGKIGEDKKIEFFNAVIGPTNEHKITSASATSSGYLAFDLYFRNASSEEKEILIKGSEFTEGADSFAHLATRLAFVNAGWHNVNAADTSSLTEVDKSGDTVKIFEPNCEKHTQDGINDYIAYGKEDGHEDFGGTGKLKYYGVEGTVSAEELDRYTASVGKLTEVDTVTVEAEGTDETQTTVFFKLAKNAVTKITVYIWIEGQDADCTNTISNNSFKASLKFTVKEA